MTRLPMSPTAASAVLNVGLAATRQEVDRAFRARARLCHPDRFAGSSAAEQAAASTEFIRACDARDVLHSRLRAAAAAEARRPAGPGRQAGARPRSGPVTPPPLTFADFVRARDAASWTYANPTGPPRGWPAPPQSGPQQGGRADGGRAQGAQPPGPRSHPTGAQNDWPSGPRDWAPPAPPGAAGGPWRPAPRRSRAPWLVFFLVVGVIGVGAYLAMLLSNQLSPGIAQLLVPPSVEAATGSDMMLEASVLPVVDDATLMANCTSEFGCWVWSVTTRADCPVATVTVGFSDTPDGVTTRTSTRQVFAQAEVPFLIVEEGVSSATEFAGIQTITC